MKTTRHRPGWRLACLGLALASLSGCQTWYYGMTLPSPHYLDHPPEYIAPSPPFPLSKELAQQEAIWAAPAPGTPATPLPPQVPPGGG